MALALAAVVTLGTLDATTPASAQGTWCAHYSGKSGGTNCGFFSQQQCREAVSGEDGECAVNPWPPRKRHRDASRPIATKQSGRA
jgi:hypothetical protein